MTASTPHPVARKTIAGNATLDGRGLFSGKHATITFKPSDRGLTFIRADVAASIPVHSDAVTSTAVHGGHLSGPPRSTNLARGHAYVATVEHALSALSGLGITDCDIEIDGLEVPIFDGSAQPFVEAIQRAGIRDVEGELEPVTIEQPIKLEHMNASIVAEPREQPGWSIAYNLDYGASASIPAQTATWDGSADAYIREIAPARTFCLEHEATALQRAGLFEGLTPADMLVVGPDGPIDNTYRFDPEPAAHKLLDVIGDLALAGRPIQANIVATRSGHQMNQRLASALVNRFPRHAIEPRA